MTRLTTKQKFQIRNIIASTQLDGVKVSLASVKLMIMMHHGKITGDEAVAMIIARQIKK